MKWIAALVLVLSLTGCGADEPTEVDPATPNTSIPTKQLPTISASPSSSAKPTATPSQKPTPTPSATPTTAEALDLSNSRIPQFRNVAGDITCLFEDFEGIQVRCDVLGAKWPVAKPADCRGAYGDSVTLARVPVLTCHGDTIFSPDDMLTLASGKSAVFEGLTCTMAPSSVTCRNDAGSSFTVSKPSYTLD